MQNSTSFKHTFWTANIIQSGLLQNLLHRSLWRQWDVNRGLHVWLYWKEHQPILTSQWFQTGETLFGSWWCSKVSQVDLIQPGSNRVLPEIARMKRASLGSLLFLKGILPKLVLGTNLRPKHSDQAFWSWQAIKSPLNAYLRTSTCWSSFSLIYPTT